MKAVYFLFPPILLLVIFVRPASSYYNARYYDPPFPQDLLEAYHNRDCSLGVISPCPPCGGSWSAYCLANVIRRSDMKHMCWVGCLESREGCPGCAPGECSVTSEDRCFQPSALPTPTSTPTPIPTASPTPHLPLACPRSFFAPTIKLSCFDPEWLSEAESFESSVLGQEIQAKNTSVQKGIASKLTSFLSRLLDFFLSLAFE